MNTILQKKPDFIIRDDKPVAVILDIDEYEALLEKLEDEDDLQYLREARKNHLHFRSFDEYLAEHNLNV